MDRHEKLNISAKILGQSLCYCSVEIVNGNRLAGYLESCFENLGNCCEYLENYFESRENYFECLENCSECLHTKIDRQHFLRGAEGEGEPLR